MTAYETNGPARIDFLAPCPIHWHHHLRSRLAKHSAYL